jgi:putative heme iron utilization protein
MKNKALEARINEEVLLFLGSRKSLHLATLGSDGLPFASYAPFAIDGESLSVILSDIAIHGLNLKARPEASILIIEDEDTATELFARKRLAYNVIAEAPKPGDIEWKKAVEALEHAHGTRPRQLSELEDFQVFRLTPSSGRFVTGFGRAYSLMGTSLTQVRINHVKIGHQSRVS